MIGRAIITLGIGPHSSFCCFSMSDVTINMHTYTNCSFHRHHHHHLFVKKTAMAQITVEKE